MGLPACPHYALNAPRKARRVVAKVEFHFGELFPRVGFIVTNLETESRRTARDGSQRKSSQKLQFGDRRLTACDKIHGIRESKMEVPEMRAPTRCGWGYNPRWLGKNR
jgi:hypothetical protein